MECGDWKGVWSVKYFVLVDADFVFQTLKSGFIPCYTFLRENQNMFRLPLRDTSSSQTNNGKALEIVPKFSHMRPRKPL